MDYSSYDPLTRKLIVYEREMEDIEREKARNSEPDPELDSKMRWLRSQIDQIDNIWPR